MSISETAEPPSIIEPAVVPDVYASGVHNIENLGGGLCRFILYVQQGPDRVVVGRVLMDSTAIYKSAKWALTKIGAVCVGGFASYIH